MNIAIFTDTFVPLTDGVVTSTVNLAKGLADRGHTIYIVAPKFSKAKKFTYKNIHVRRSMGIPAFFYPGFKFTSVFNPRIIKELKSKKIDVIHFQTPLTLGIQAISAAKLLKKPLVGTFHTLITDEQYIQHIVRKRKLVQRSLKKISWNYVRAYYDRCDLITCPSESTKQELIKNKLKKPIKVISNGIDLFSFDNTNWKKAKQKYHLNDKTILFVGRITYEKNLSYLLDCFTLVVGKISDAKLLIVGDGPQMKLLKEKIIRKKLSGNVILAGSIEHKALLASGIFKACKIFATTSTTETQGISTLEAQANGLVCVGMDARGTKSLITNNENGYLIKRDKKAFAEKIITLLSDEKLYRQMKKNTLGKIKKHDIRKVIDQWEETYAALIHCN